MLRLLNLAQLRLGLWLSRKAVERIERRAGVFPNNDTRSTIPT